MIADARDFPGLSRGAPYRQNLRVCPDTWALFSLGKEQPAGMSYSFLAFKPRLALDARARQNINELVRLSYFYSGDLPALANVELGGRTPRNFCAPPPQGSSKNQSWPRYPMFFLLERLDRGGGNSLSALARHNYEGNFAGFLVRCKRRVHFSPPNVQPRVANFPWQVRRGIRELGL